MNQIIEHDDSRDEADKVIIGENNTLVPYKVYQDIYHQITGRTEQIKKRYSENLQIDITEIEQLHYKIMQLCGVHKVVGKNETISIFHVKERKEQFTSFERFKLYNTNTSSPTFNVVLKYNFSIIPSGLQKPQEYVITIRLTSRVTLLGQLEKDMPPFMRGAFANAVSSNTAEISIEYADYVIARGFLEAFDEWINGCDSVPNSIILTWLRKWSHIIPKILQVVIVMIIAWYGLQTISDYFAKSEMLGEALSRFFIIYSAATIVLLILAKETGGMIEDTIDSYPTLAYLKLNKGDEKMIKAFSRRRSVLIIKFLISSVLTIVLGLIGTKIGQLL